MKIVEITKSQGPDVANLYHTSSPNIDMSGQYVPLEEVEKIVKDAYDVGLSNQLLGMKGVNKQSFQEWFKQKVKEDG